MRHWSEVSRGEPLFENVFVFDNYPFAATVAQRECGLEIENVQLTERSNYPLVFIVSGGQELTVELEVRCGAIQ